MSEFRTVVRHLGTVVRISATVALGKFRGAEAGEGSARDASRDGNCVAAPAATVPADEIAASGLFDPAFYAARYPQAEAAPLDHYLACGIAQGFRPSAAFDPALYLALNPDVADTGLPPLLHYIRQGREQGRPLREDRAALAAEVEFSGLFDPDFYAVRHPAAAAAPLAHYLAFGLRQEFRPSAAFDPDLYLALNPDVAAAGLPSFLHYVRHGRDEGRPVSEPSAVIAAEVRASGLFDPVFYAARCPDAVAAPLAHYLAFGLKQEFQPSAAFDPVVYLALNPDVAAAGSPSLLHFIRHGRREGRSTQDRAMTVAGKIAASGLFDPEFYLEMYPRAAGAGDDPLSHFLHHGARAGWRPSAEFDPEAYLADYPDVAAAGEDALSHYVLRGRAEGRTPRPGMDRATLSALRERLAASESFDADFYLAQHPVARARGVDPVLHFLVEGARFYVDPSPRFSTSAYAAARPGPALDVPSLVRDLCAGPVAREAPPMTPAVALAAARMSAVAYFTRHGFAPTSSGPTTHLGEALARLAQVPPRSLDISGRPNVSIVIPVYGQMPFVAACLDALCHHRSRHSVEIIVSDDASPVKEGVEALEAVPWIRYRRNAENLGYLRNCNVAAASARGRFIVLLNSDTRVLDGWLDELIDTFDLFPRAGYVGSKLLNFDGTLQEAGGIYWSDGTAQNHGRGRSADDPRFNFARQVDWVSGASIALPTDMWRALDGFNEAFQPAYCEDVDLALRVRERGREVWYQPLSQALHFEGMTHGTEVTSGVKAHQVRNLERLRSMWSGRLPGVRTGGDAPFEEADRTACRRMLVIDANVPKPDRDAGSVVASEMMRMYRDLGFRQTFVPLHNFGYQPGYFENCQRLGVEVVHSPFYRSIDDLLGEGRDYDYVLVFRYGVAMEVLDKVRRAWPLVRVIFSNVDLHFLRSERQAALTRDGSLRVRAARMETDELGVFARVDCSIVHTAEEAAVVQARLTAPVDNIVVLPWVARAVPSLPDLDARRDIVFVGGFAHPPNVDAVDFFMGEVWPCLVKRLPDDARFLIVGNAPPPRVQAAAGHRIVVTGHVPAIEPYLARARVSVAPLRFGAGIKGKVIQSLSNGVPTVATRIAVEGIPAVDGEHILLADDAPEIVDAILRLYGDDDLWMSLRASGHALVEQHFTLESALRTCDNSLDVADTTWITRERQRSM